MVFRRHKSVALAAGILMAAGIAWAPPARGAGDSRESERKPAEGPVARLPEAAPMQQAQTGRPGSDSGSTGVGSGGGALVGSFFGGISDPDKEAERRIKKLIRRLG